MSKYEDKLASLMVLGQLLKTPSILDKPETYAISYNDFSDPTYGFCFVAINNLFVNGLKKIEILDVANYLMNNYAKEYEQYKIDNGDELLKRAIRISDENKFDYYYDKMKKMTLLRTYDNYGIDIKDIYNPNLLDANKREEQERNLEKMYLLEIVASVDNKIERIKQTALLSEKEEGQLVGEGLYDLVQRLRKAPEIGAPLPFGIYNTIVKGARKKKFYLTSASSGFGKTRNMAANACYLTCAELFNPATGGWEALPTKGSALFITTELEVEEIQTMMLAFISSVNEDKILGLEPCSDFELELIDHAIRIMEEADLYIQEMPDFSISDIENTIKINIEKNGTEYIFLDYIHTSLRILEEISSKTHGMKLREDNVLFMLSIKLKDIANQYNVFLQSATQTNSKSESDEDANASMLRGARAIADKTDFAEIMTKLSEKDKEVAACFCQKLGIPDDKKPNMVRNIFKNRRGRYTNGKVFCHADLGTCRIEPLFFTFNDYTLEAIPVYNVKVKG